jgi:hypothetical protein
MASIALFASLGLVVHCAGSQADCPQATQATFRSFETKATGVPVREWPESRERPEKTEPPHGEGSGESVMYIGIHSDLSTNTANVSTVIVDSGASGWQPLPPTTWLPNGLNLITSRDGLVELFPATPCSANNADASIHPNTTKHLTNPSTIQERRSYTRRL